LGHLRLLLLELLDRFWVHVFLRQVSQQNNRTRKCKPTMR
jgi:hypothetical protein